jgi:TPR repeat protein
LIVVLALAFQCCAPSAAIADVPPFSSPAEQQYWERKALAGDNEAAENLAARLNDDDKAVRWLKLAARRGDCNAMGLVSEHYIEKKNADAAAQWVELGKTRCEAYPRMYAYVRTHRYDQDHAQLVANARAGNCKALEEVVQGYQRAGLRPEPWVRVVSRKSCNGQAR